MDAFLFEASFQKSHTILLFTFCWPELNHLAIPRFKGVWEILLPKYNWPPVIKEEGKNDCWDKHQTVPTSAERLCQQVVLPACSHL